MCGGHLCGGHLCGGHLCGGHACLQWANGWGWASAQQGLACCKAGARVVCEVNQHSQSDGQEDLML